MRHVGVIGEYGEEIGEQLKREVVESETQK